MKIFECGDQLTKYIKENSLTIYKFIPLGDKESKFILSNQERVLLKEIN